jgi:YVTN family beta-propeller protein
MRLRRPKDNGSIVQRIARSRFTVASAVVICAAALAAGNATAAFGSVSSSPAAVAASRPALRPPDASRFSRWLSLRDDDANLADAAGLGGREDGPAGSTIAAGSGPAAVAVDQASHTAYVGNDNDNTVSVINTATCNSVVTAGCDQTPPTVAVGPSPVDLAVDQATDTIYVATNGTDTISVIDGKTCNAEVTWGCGQTAQTITVGENDDGVAVNEITDTVYVADVNENAVSVINGAICNANDMEGCGQTPETVNVGVGPGVPAVNEATDTIYVPNAPTGADGSVSVIDGATCNATVHSGCGNTPPTITLGFNTMPFAAAVDEATDTVYEVAYGPSTGTATTLGSVYVINGATCNATVTFGCSQTPPIVTVGSQPDGLVVDPLTESVFVVNEGDSTLSVIDGAICNALDTAGCSQRPPEVATGFNPGGNLDVDLATDTVYVPNMDENTVSVIDGSACTETHQSGCRHAVPTTTVGSAPQGIAVNQATDTVYVGNRSDNDLSVINGALCSASQPSGCGRGWPTVATGPAPQAVAVDQRTDTIYTANSDPNNNFSGTTVSVIDGATCNAGDNSGCGRAPATVTVGNGPNALAVSQSTDTIYVANINDNTVSVINGATCNATVTTGCGQAPPVIKVGSGPDGVAVDQATDTIYVANAGDNTVSVINGATCNAIITSGCGHAPPTIAVGNGPYGVAVDQITHTLYVANAGGSTVSVINAAICNASVTSGCGQNPPTMATEGLPFGVALDQASDTIYVDSIVGSSTDIFNGATCNATVTSGCGQTPVSLPMGGWPSNVTVNPATGTVYVPDNVDGQVSFFGYPPP